jgi:GR25 family glycosyltransferase involved in LPS biosynthesis
VYYINLKNRLDRNTAARNQLTLIPYPFHRINAVKFTEMSAELIPYKYFRIISAVKKSHMNSYQKFLASQYDYALILEDDFQIDLLNFSSEIDSACDLMKSNAINFLQVGHLSYIESGPSSSKNELFARKIFERLLRFVDFVRFPSTPFVPKQIRWGAQAYIIDRHAAKSLLNLVDVFSQKPIEVEFKQLCLINEGEENYLNIARMKRNIIRQNLCFSSDIQGVV